METLLMKFVERVLYVWDSSDIKEFVIDFDVKCDASRVKSWITAAVRRNVQILSLCLWDSRENFSLPHCVFSCETLRILNLDIPCILKIPPIICFSNLNIVNITDVTFPDGYTTQQLFLNPTDSDCCQVTIFGASLNEFLYAGEFCDEYWLYNSFSLERVEIDVSYSDERARQVAYRMFKVLTELPNVKDLKLQGSGVEVLTYAAELLPNMPIFNNLMYLELASLSLDCAAINCENDDIILDPVPPCFFSDLETIEVIRSSGDKEELSVLKILLKNAVAYSLFIDVPVSDRVFGVSR
ncbi:F-box/FBD/LRR-repeat protein At5g56420-like [Corylus avellana]|uniref:F-box/FBD/LRR-repeat protein At5g56420-like n=1 Tax=Corylus avellana TaxID=13451 RepID=UPI00286B530E|nr:F-box/FBD/LRR-repeat protein At5g56420-like [Corylus avellana]